MALAVLGLFGCSKHARVNHPQLELELRALDQAPTVARDGARPVAYPLLTTQRWTRAPDLVTNARGTMSFYTEPEVPRALRVLARPLSDMGSPAGNSVEVAKIAEDAPLLSFGATSRAFLAVMTAFADRGEALSLVRVSIKGVADKPVEILRTPNHVMWAQIVSGASGASLVWAEQTPEGTATILSLGLDADGVMLGVPVRRVERVRAWQIVDAASDWALVYGVSGGEGKTTLRLEQFTYAGAKVSAGARVAEIDQLEGDLQAVPMAAGGYLVGWTNNNGGSRKVHLLWIDHSFTREATLPGGRALRTLEGGTEGAYAFTLDESEPPGPNAEVHLVHAIGGQLVVHSGASFRSATKGAWASGSIDAGAALLAPVVVCPLKTPCDAPAVPTLMRFDRRGHVTETQPILLSGDEHAAETAWALRCRGQRCLALAASSTSQGTHTFAMDLASRPSRYGAAPAPHALSGNNAYSSLISGHDVIASAPIVDYTIATREKETIIVTIQRPPIVFQNASKKRRKNRGLDVVVSRLDGETATTLAILASDASELGQVAASSAPDKTWVIAWVESDGKASAIRVVRINAEGRIVRDGRLAPSPGDKMSLTLRATDSGWIAAWVDTRHRRNEVYAIGFNARLRRAQPERRISGNGSDASDVALALVKGRPWFAWAEANKDDGAHDIYVTNIDLFSPAEKSEKLSAHEVVSTPADSRNPHWSIRGDNLSLRWVEQPLPTIGNVGSASYGAATLMLGERGEPASAMARLSPGGPGDIADVMTRDGSETQNWLVRQATDGIFVDECENVACKGWLKLDAQPPFDTFASIVDGYLYFLDALETDGAVRRLRRVPIGSTKRLQGEMPGHAMTSSAQLH